MPRHCSLTQGLRNPLFVDIRPMIDFHDKRTVALSIVGPLGGKVGGFVIPRFCPFPDMALKDRNCKRFFPAYLGDMPYYAREEARNLTLKGTPPTNPDIDAFTVCADVKIIQAAIEGRQEAIELMAERHNQTQIEWSGPAIFVQTFLSHIGLKERDDVLDKILRRVERAEAAGADGVVISGQELPEVRERFPDICIAVGGIRSFALPRIPDDDQVRAISVEKALEHEADILIVGRPITYSGNPVKVTEIIIVEINNIQKQMEQIEREKIQPTLRL